MKSILTPKSFLTYSLGCRTNQAEIEELGQQLVKIGWQQAGKNDEPDIVLLNTCAVTAKAESETRKEIKRLRKLYPKAFLAILGCAVEIKNNFGGFLPEADLFIDNKEKSQAINLILESLKLNSFSIKSLQPTIINPYISSGRKFIKIQTGCDFFCSFCLTAYLRGAPRSIPLEKIIKEVDFWIKKGVKEIVLTGVNISLYGKDFNSRLDVVYLIKQILARTAVERVSLSSIYPEMLNKDFLNLVIQNKRISRFFHLSIQSGSPSVLNRMNRKTDLTKLKKSLQYIKEAIPEFTFKADFIAGFPNETEEEFKETLQFIKETGVAFAHIFPFSKRKGTVAFEMIAKGYWKDLSSQIKKERAKTIMKTVKEIRENEAKKYISKLLNCLFVRGKKDYWEGIAENGWPVKIKTTKLKQKTAKIKGQILPVKITGYVNDWLLGEIISLPK